MAKVLVTFCSGIFDGSGFLLPVYYDGFLTSLKNSGNDVKYAVTNDFITSPWNGLNETNTGVLKSKLINDIKDFNPDIVFTFNNSNLEDIDKELDCPIVVMESDTYFFYNDKDKLKSNSNRYFYISASEEILKEMKKEFSIKDDKAIISKFATAIRPEKIKQDKNISFIGSCFNPPEKFQNELRKYDTEKVKKVMDSLFNDVLCDYDELLKKNDIAELGKEFSKGDFLTVGTVSKRIELLNSLSDLGLVIYGNKTWSDMYKYSMKLAMCFNDKKVYSLQHNQDIYNSSKVCINNCHLQASTAFPWRVLDIMGSNGCLVSDYNKGIEKMCKGYVDIPMYHNNYEAYDLCQKLLKDDKWRKDIVQSSNAYVDEFGRFEHRFKDIGELVGVDLLGNKDKGSLERIVADDYISNSYKIMVKTVETATKIVPSSSYRFFYKILERAGIKLPYILKKTYVDKYLAKKV